MRHLLAAILAAGALATVLPAQLGATPVATGLRSPVYVTSPADDARLFIVEQQGRIKILKDGVVLPRLFLDLNSIVATNLGERGLLGMAFHPDYATNGFFYVSYTRALDLGSIVARYQVSATDPDRADPTGTILLGPIAQPYDNHNGGCIQFGPDGYLYFGLGDGGASGDPGCRAQNRQNLLGKILRLDVDNPNSLIPPSNPFVGDPSTLDEIWALGVRNPWRFSFDSETGDLWIGDVGQNRVEEIDFQPASSAGGENYGWKVMEGDSCFGSPCNGAPACNSPLYSDPIQTYTHSAGCSVTGGYVYRGCAIPSLRGTYFYADYCSRRIWTLRYESRRVTDWRLRTEFGQISSIASFGEDAQGELYIVSRGGTVFRIAELTPDIRDLGYGTPGGNGQVPSFSGCGQLASGESARFELSGAAASAPAGLILGTQNNPTNLPPFGILVPNPWLMTFPFTTDANGAFAFTLPGGTGAVVAYTQIAVVDGGASGGAALSNALEIVFH